MTTTNSTENENMFNFNKENTNDEEDINPEDYTFQSWDDRSVDLNKKLLRGIYSYGFEKPSPIQKKAVTVNSSK